MFDSGCSRLVKFSMVRAEEFPPALYGLFPSKLYSIDYCFGRFDLYVFILCTSS
jgi:hypothetical protein